ncbi:hypothetical protein HK098_002870 [Nowakowskiella sp. JEL0407]|nr:hypothetical protein HK098_002870 [Nowakowskiella sp. JEL0407]
MPDFLHLNTPDKSVSTAVLAAFSDKIKKDTPNSNRRGGRQSRQNQQPGQRRSAFENRGERKSNSPPRRNGGRYIGDGKELNFDISDIDSKNDSTVHSRVQSFSSDKHSKSVSSENHSSNASVISAGDKTFYVGSEFKNTRTLRAHVNMVRSVAFSYDGQKILSASSDGTIVISNTSTLDILTTLYGHTEAVNGVVINRNGTLIVSGSTDKTVKIWDAKTGKEIRTLQGHLNAVNTVAISDDSTLIASGAKDNTVILWDVYATEQRILKGHSGIVMYVAINDDGTLIASGSMDMTVKIWGRSGKEIRTLAGHREGVNCIALCSEKQLIVSGSSDRTLRLWDWMTGNQLRTYVGHTDFVRSVTFGMNGKIIVSGSWDKTVKIWDTESGIELQTLKGNREWVLAVAINKDGNAILSGGGDDAVKIWESADAQQENQVKRDERKKEELKFEPSPRFNALPDTFKLLCAQCGVNIGNHAPTNQVFVLSENSAWVYLAQMTNYIIDSVPSITSSTKTFFRCANGHKIGSVVSKSKSDSESSRQSISLNGTPPQLPPVNGIPFFDVTRVMVLEHNQFPKMGNILYLYINKKNPSIDECTQFVTGECTNTDYCRRLHFCESTKRLRVAYESFQVAGMERTVREKEEEEQKCIRAEEIAKTKISERERKMEVLREEQKRAAKFMLKTEKLVSKAKTLESVHTLPSGLKTTIVYNEAPTFVDKIKNAVGNGNDNPWGIKNNVDTGSVPVARNNRKPKRNSQKKNDTERNKVLPSAANATQTDLQSNNPNLESLLLQIQQYRFADGSQEPLSNTIPQTALNKSTYLTINDIVSMANKRDSVTVLTHLHRHCNLLVEGLSMLENLPTFVQLFEFIVFMEALELEGLDIWKDTLLTLGESAEFCKFVEDLMEVEEGDRRMTVKWFFDCLQEKI